ADLSALSIRRLEAQYLSRLLERVDRQVTERRLDCLEASLDRDGIRQPLGLHVLREVLVQEGSNGHVDRSFRYVRRHARSATRHDLRDDLRFPEAFGRLLRFDPLSGAARHREVVDVHSPPPTLVLDVEPPGVLTTWARSTA